jgi:hypothetical protein
LAALLSATLLSTLTLLAMALLTGLALLTLLSLLSRLTFSGLTLLALLTGLSLLPLLPLLTWLLTILAALELSAILLIAIAVAALGAATLLRLSELLHPVAHGFHLRQRFLDVVLVAARTTLAGLGLVLHGGLRLLQLIAKVVESLGDSVFANPGGHAVAPPDVLGVATHVQFDFVLLSLGKRIPQFVRNRILRSGHTASRLAHVFLQLLELFGHLIFFGRQLFGLLLRLAGLLAVGARRVAGIAHLLTQPVLEVGLVFG